MLRRKITERLEEWKNRDSRKPLIIEGARQVGKTFSVREFAKRKYSSFIEINFYENEDMKDVFEDSLDADTVLNSIKINRPGLKMTKGDTLIFLDEIQECPRAITALKFLAGNPDFDVIASGSALGIAYGMTSSFPVGYVDFIEMHSLDFEEFLWAIGIDDNIIKLLENFFHEQKKIPKAIHERMLDYIRQYIVIGGMPEVVNSFLEDRDYYLADSIQKAIIKGYINDIAHYARPEIKIKAEKCYRSIPFQLSKENHKFQYSKVEHKGTKRKFGTSIDWLINADMAVAVSNVSKVEYPLKGFAQTDNIRLYTNDIGLLTGTYDYSLKKAVLNDSNLDDPSESLVLKSAKGGLYEALACDILTKNGHETLCFFKNQYGTIEVEFIIEGNDGVIPIEIKAGRSRTQSLDRLLESDEIPYGYKFSSQNVGKSGKKITMPIYMMMFI